MGPRLPLGEDLVVGHVHARGATDTEGSSLSPRIKRRIRAKTSLAEIERKERGRANLPGPPRLRTLVADAAEVPISEGSLVPASTPTSGPQRAHPYTPVGDAVGSSSFEMVPPVRARAASDRGFDESTDTIPIARANSSPSIIQVPTQETTPLKILALIIEAQEKKAPQKGELMELTCLRENQTCTKSWLPFCVAPLFANGNGPLCLPHD